MKGHHTLVWASEVGEVVYTKKDFSGVTLKIQTEVADKNSYGGSCTYTGIGRNDYTPLERAITN
jgi:hypothetical protein